MTPEDMIRGFFLTAFVFLALVWLAMGEDTYGQYRTAGGCGE